MFTSNSCCFLLDAGWGETNCSGNQHHHCCFFWLFFSPYWPSCSYGLTSAFPGELMDTTSKWNNGISPALSMYPNGLFECYFGELSSRRQKKGCCHEICRTVLSLTINALLPFPRRGGKQLCDGCVWGFMLILSIALSVDVETNDIREKTGCI